MRISVQESSSRSPFLPLESCFGVSVVQVKHSLQEEALHSHQARGIWRVQSPHLGGRGGRMEHISRLRYLAAEDCLE